MADGGEDIFNKRCPLEEEAEMLGEEEGEYEKKRQYCIDQGMVEIDSWKDKIKELYPDLPESGLNPLEVVIQAAKAICVVVRNRGSQQRYDYHCKMERDPSLSAEEQKIHHNKAEECFKKRCCGTGFLFGVLLDSVSIITNSHVIMNDEEAKGAVVYFDYDKDGQLHKAKRFEVKRLLFGAPPTDHEGDYTKLDFSVLEVKCKNEEEFQLLKDHLFVDKDYNKETITPSVTSVLDMPIVIISHPRGLGKRLSSGKVSDIVKGHVSHVKHTLGTGPGSSGGNVLAFGKTDGSGFVASVGLHYRHHRGVLWGSIIIECMLAEQWAEYQRMKDQLFFPPESEAGMSLKRLQDLWTSATLCQLMRHILISRDSPSSPKTVPALKRLEDFCTCPALCELMKHISTSTGLPNPTVTEAAMGELDRLEGLWTSAALVGPMTQILSVTDSPSPQESEAEIQKLVQMERICAFAANYELYKLMLSVTFSRSPTSEAKIREQETRFWAFQAWIAFERIREVYTPASADSAMDEIIRSAKNYEDMWT